MLAEQSDTTGTQPDF